MLTSLFRNVSDAYWNREDNHSVVLDYFIPIGSSRGWKINLLQPNSSRDGEGL